MDIYCTVPSLTGLTPTKVGEARIQQNAHGVVELVRVIPENGRHETIARCENSFVPENGHLLYGTAFHAVENGRG